jgi:DNA-binding transcriptional LysR family regulator
MSAAIRSKRTKTREAARPDPSFLTTPMLCFFAAARLGSIRAAADHLHLAPSAVSRHISKLEAALSTPLFERLPRGLRVNSAGELFLYHARESAKLIERARSQISDMQGLKRGHVSIGTPESVAIGFLPRLITDFWKQYSEITISIVAMRSSQAFAGVVEGELDLAIGFDMPAKTPLRVLASARLQIGAWMPRRHKLAKGSVRFKDIVGDRILLPDESIRLRSLLNSQLRQHGNVEARLISNSTSVLDMFAAQGNGISFSTKVGLAGFHLGKDLVFKPIQDLATKTQNLLLCARERGLSPSATVLVDFLTPHITGLSDI